MLTAFIVAVVVAGIISGVYAIIAADAKNTKRLQREAEIAEAKKKAEEKEKVRQEVLEDLRRENINLNRLEDELLQGLDSPEMYKIVSRIYWTGKRLTKTYRPESDACSQVLNAYKVYIDGYMGSAASLARKYRRSKMFLQTLSQENIKQEIENLEKRIGQGATELENTLKEKQTTLLRLQNIREKQDLIKKGLEEIEATLQSLHTALFRAETSESTKEEIRKEIHITISTLSQALDETFGKLKNL